MKQNDFIDLLFPEAFVKKIDIKEITPCTADPDRIKFLAQTDKPLGEVLPILYLSIPNAKYSEKLEALSYRYKQHLVTMFSSGRIGMTYVKDRNEAEKLVEEAKNLINRAFIHLKTHGKPTPELIGAKKELDPMKIYEKLPKTNCKECGEQGCFAFAAKLLNSEKSLQDCPPLTTEKYSTNKTQIEKMMHPIRL
ncbi:MAG: (Fe-S)-binding protein [Candidatus Bathyarchaeia archaeon]